MIFLPKNNIHQFQWITSNTAMPFTLFRLNFNLHNSLLLSVMLTTLCDVFEDTQIIYFHSIY